MNKWYEHELLYYAKCSPVMWLIILFFKKKDIFQTLNTEYKISAKGEKERRRGGGKGSIQTLIAMNFNDILVKIQQLFQKHR